MTRLVVNFAADRDIDEILLLIGRSAGKQAVARFDADLDRLYDRLIVFPESGAPRPRLGANVRIGVIRPYVVDRLPLG